MASDLGRHGRIALMAEETSRRNSCSSSRSEDATGARSTRERGYETLPGNHRNSYGQRAIRLPIDAAAGAEVGRSIRARTPDDDRAKTAQTIAQNDVSASRPRQIQGGKRRRTSVEDPGEIRGTP